MSQFARYLLGLPVLSVRQPWASYLVSGHKTMELRTWTTSYKGWLWIHAGKKPDLLAMQLLELQEEEFSCGGLLGLANLEHCQLIEGEERWLALRGDHLSPGYFQGRCYGWHFSDALSLGGMIQCRGELGLFRLAGLASERVYDAVTGESNRDFVQCARDIVNRALATN